MIKKYGTRFLACFMACVIAFNVIAIPKAKAATIIDATEVFGSNITAAFARVVGVKPLTSSFSATGSGFKSLATKYTAATGAFANASLFFTAIAAGAKINEKHLELTKQSYAYMVDFFNWVIEEFDLIGEDGTPVTEPVGIVAGSDFCLYNDVRLPNINTVWTDKSSYPYALWRATSSGPYQFILSSKEPIIKYDELRIEDEHSYKIYTYTPSTNTFVLSSEYEKTSYSSLGRLPFWTSFDFCYYNGTLYLAASEPVVGEDWENPDLSVSLDPEYESAPEVLDGQQIKLNIEDVPDLDGDGTVSEDEFNEYIPAAIYAGDYAPTYEITVVGDSGADVAPDVGGDAGANTELGFLERIANGIDALADKIAEGFAEIFAPDPALMQDISDTFNSKFGFVSTLHQLGTDLLSIDATSAPPVVYIHLEDAEGSIYYGETVKALDMSWYARYKEDVDRIMSGFLWLGFLWLLFKRASAIIQGAEMATDYGVDVHDGYRIRGERNGKRF